MSSLQVLSSRADILLKAFGNLPKEVLELLKELKDLKINEEEISSQVTVRVDNVDPKDRPSTPSHNGLPNWASWKGPGPEPESWWATDPNGLATKVYRDYEAYCND